jgi:hypothetical protein
MQETLLSLDKAILSRHETSRFARVFSWSGTKARTAHKNIFGIRLATLAHAMPVAQLHQACLPSHAVRLSALVATSSNAGVCGDEEK